MPEPWKQPTSGHSLSDGKDGSTGTVLTLITLNPAAGVLAAD